MRTYKRVKETLRFKGTVMNKSDGSRIVIGRVVPEADSHGNYNQITDMIEELQFDSLTRVYNKKTITAYAVKCLKEEQNNRVTIAVLDVDHFKKVNDVYGHMYGDKVLARVGRKLKEVVGEDGVVGRIGGDEFVMLIRDCTEEKVQELVSTMRGDEKGNLSDVTAEFYCRLAIGGAFRKTAETLEETIKRADDEMYKNKHSVRKA
jgi:diguanylate cyclase (GGDEF)-like protein